MVEHGTWQNTGLAATAPSEDLLYFRPSGDRITLELGAWLNVQRWQGAKAEVTEEKARQALQSAKRPCRGGGEQAEASVMIPGGADGTARGGRHREPEGGEAKLRSIGEHPSPRWEGSAWPSGPQLHPPHLLWLYFMACIA